MVLLMTCLLYTSFVNETRAKGGNPVLFNSIVRRNFLPKGVTELKGSYEKEGPVLVAVSYTHLF